MMWNRAELKMRGNMAFKKNYVSAVVVLIVLVAKVFVGNLLKMGGYRFFILNQTAQPGIGTLLDGFRSGHYVNIVLTMFLRDLFTWQHYPAP